MNVAAIIVTRGDQDLTPIVAALPEEWEVVIWDNAREEHDLAVYGRYAAIERTDAELIYVQDDDCIVSDPAAIARRWLLGHGASNTVVCNMPAEFRHEFYEDHALVGFGAVFHRDAPGRSFRRFDKATHFDDAVAARHEFLRTCDVVFTGLTPRVLVDVPYENLPWAHHETRMWKQPGHLAERTRMLDLVRQLA